MEITVEIDQDTGLKRCTKRFGAMHILVFLPLIFNNHLEKSGRVTSQDTCHLLETIQSNIVIATLTEIDAFQTGFKQIFSLTAMLDLQGRVAWLGRICHLVETIQSNCDCEFVRNWFLAEIQSYHDA